MLRVPLLENHARVRLVPSAAYGATESVLPGRDRHHRMSAGAGAAVSFMSGFAGELRMDTRYDQHAAPSEDSGVIDARALLRYARAVSERTALGAQLNVWVPGEKAPQPAFDATTLDLLGLVGIKASERWTVSFQGGYRNDRSARSIKSAERLSQADFIALGLSDFDAALVGLGAQQAFERTRWFCELTADLLVGKGAPGLSRSPLRAALGASTELGRPSTRGSLIAQALLSDRVKVDVNGPLVPFEPRFTVMLALSQDFDWGEKPDADHAAEAPAEKPVAPVVEPEPAPAAVALPLGVLRVMVRDTDRGEAVPARVRVTKADGTLVEAEQKPAARGGIELELAPGSYEVEISADGFASQRRKLSIDEHGVTLINIDLRPKGGR